MGFCRLYLFVDESDSDHKTCSQSALSMHSRDFLRVANDGHGYRFLLGHSFEILDQSRELSSDVGLDDLLAALRTYPRWNRFNNYQFSLKPKVLIDSLFFHLLTADVAFSIIVS